MEVQETLKIGLVGIPSLREAVGGVFTPHLQLQLHPSAAASQLSAILPQLYVGLGVLEYLEGERLAKGGTPFMHLCRRHNPY